MVARAALVLVLLPGGTLTTARGERRIPRLVRCRAVRHARAFSGLGIVTVLTVDLAKGLPAVDADALMTDAQTVYASKGSLYLATQRQDTAIHRFDASERGRGDRLAEIGRVSGLGPGEQIHGVRFIGDAGYVVTFRQIDPLYVLDLSDPARPLSLSGGTWLPW